MTMMLVLKSSALLLLVIAITIPWVTCEKTEVPSAPGSGFDFDDVDADRSGCVEGTEELQNFRLQVGRILGEALHLSNVERALRAGRITHSADVNGDGRICQCDLLSILVTESTGPGRHQHAFRVYEDGSFFDDVDIDDDGVLSDVTEQEGMTQKLAQCVPVEQARRVVQTMAKLDKDDGNLTRDEYMLFLKSASGPAQSGGGVQPSSPPGPRPGLLPHPLPPALSAPGKLENFPQQQQQQQQQSNRAEEGRPRKRLLLPPLLGAPLGTPQQHQQHQQQHLGASLPSPQQHLNWNQQRGYHFQPMKAAGGNHPEQPSSRSPAPEQPQFPRSRTDPELHNNQQLLDMNPLPHNPQGKEKKEKEEQTLTHTENKQAQDASSSSKDHHHNPHRHQPAQSPTSHQPGQSAESSLTAGQSQQRRPHEETNNLMASLLQGKQPTSHPQAADDHDDKNDNDDNDVDDASQSHQPEPATAAGEGEGGSEKTFKKKNPEVPSSSGSGQGRRMVKEKETLSDQLQGIRHTGMDSLQPDLLPKVSHPPEVHMDPLEKELQGKRKI